MKKLFSLVVVLCATFSVFATEPIVLNFKDNGKDDTLNDKGNISTGDGSKVIEDLATILDEQTASYFSSMEATNVYLGKKDKGLKFSSSKNNGSLSLTFKSAITPDSIAFEVAPWNSVTKAEDGSIVLNKIDEASVTVNGDEFNLPTDDVTFINCVKAYDGKTAVTELSVQATKRIYLRSIIIYIDSKTALNNVTANTVKATKIIENGQIYIVKDGVKYNIFGAEVK